MVFSDRALEFLREDDEETYAAIVPQMEAWNDITLVHRGERIAIDGIGFAAIGRLKLLQLLQARARSVGVEPVYRAQREEPRRTRRRRSHRRRRRRQFAGAARRMTRSSARRVGHLTNRFAWFGTSQRFETLTQTFVETELGFFNAHHYRYAPRPEHLHRRDGCRRLSPAPALRR